MRLEFIVVLLGSAGLLAAESPKVVQDPAEYAAAMKEVAAKFKGTPGVFLHLGDSITYANQNTRWGKSGCPGGSDEERAFAKWTHAGSKNDTDGWHLASVDRPSGRSETAASGVRADQYLKGGKGGLPSLDQIIQKYNPQMALYLLGTNDISAGRPVGEYIKDVETAMDKLLANGTVPILSTLPVYRGKKAQVEEYNAALKELAAKKKIPLLDLYGEMRARCGDEAEQTMVGKDGIHLTFGAAGGPPTEENLKSTGYLLRCWLAVQKGMEVKKAVLDAK